MPQSHLEGGTKQLWEAERWRDLNGKEEGEGKRGIRIRNWGRTGKKPGGAAHHGPHAQAGGADRKEAQGRGMNRNIQLPGFGWVEDL